MDEYGQAGEIYTNLGEMSANEGCFARAIDFFQKGV